MAEGNRGRALARSVPWKGRGWAARRDMQRGPSLLRMHGRLTTGTWRNRLAAAEPVRKLVVPISAFPQETGFCFSIAFGFNRVNPSHLFLSLATSINWSYQLIVLTLTLRSLGAVGRSSPGRLANRRRGRCRHRFLAGWGPGWRWV